MNILLKLFITSFIEYIAKAIEKSRREKAIEPTRNKIKDFLKK